MDCIMPCMLAVKARLQPSQLVAKAPYVLNNLSRYIFLECHFLTDQCQQSIHTGANQQ